MRRTGQPRWAHKSYGPPVDEHGSMIGYGIAHRSGSGYGGENYSWDHRQGGGTGTPAVVEDESAEMTLVVISRMMSGPRC